MWVLSWLTDRRRHRHRRSYTDKENGLIPMYKMLGKERLPPRQSIQVSQPPHPLPTHTHRFTLGTALCQLRGRTIVAQEDGSVKYGRLRGKVEYG